MGAQQSQETKPIEKLLTSVKVADLIGDQDCAVLSDVDTIDTCLKVNVITDVELKRKLFSTRRIQGVPVVNAAKKCIGVVDHMDLLMYLFNTRSQQDIVCTAQLHMIDMIRRAESSRMMIIGKF